ncbi:MAG: SH3 domain-containing protein, partial [Caldilineaceae bacterium]
MRRAIPYIVLLSWILLTLAGCSRSHVTAGSVTVVPVVTIGVTEAPGPTTDSTPTPVASSTSMIDAAPTRADSEAAVRAVSQLLERKVPTIPVRPRTGPNTVKGSPTPTPGVGTGLRLPTPTPSPDGEDTVRDASQADAGSEVAGIVTANVVNVRSGPGTIYSIAGKVERAEEVTVSGRNADGSWLQICCSASADGQNWISADFVDLLLAQGSVLDALPEVEAPPTPEAPANAAAVAPVPGSGAG